MRTILLYGVCMGLVVLLLKYIDYRFWVHSISMEIYLGLIAAIFTGLGIWMGLHLTRKGDNEKSATTSVTTASAVAEVHVSPEQALQKLNISNREFEVLQLMAKGHSNQEIANELFISLSTVKTHSSNIFSKLNVKRRTQAVEAARTKGLI